MGGKPDIRPLLLSKHKVSVQDGPRAMDRQTNGRAAGADALGWSRTDGTRPKLPSGSSWTRKHTQVWLSDALNPQSAAHQSLHPFIHLPARHKSVINTSGNSCWSLFLISMLVLYFKEYISIKVNIRNLLWSRSDSEWLFTRWEVTEQFILIEKIVISQYLRTSSFEMLRLSHWFVFWSNWMNV